MKIKNLLITMLTLILIAPSSIALEISAFNQNCDSNAQVYVDGVGCVEPKFKLTREIHVVDASKVAQSSIGDIEPIRVDNPWAAAGQPVVVSFTLENVGDQYDYPYNQIPLLPDNYALILAVDRDIGVRTPEGRFIDVWNYMAWYEKFSFMLGMMSASVKEKVSKELQGRTCGFVNVREQLPSRVTDYVDQQAGKGIAINMWDCLKIVDLPFFATEIKGLCGDKIDAACLADINKQFGQQVDTQAIVALTSFEASGLTAGQCERSWNIAGPIGKIALLLKDKQNLVSCSIGDKGLEPGDKVTFDFVALVPADAPVIPPSAIKEVTDLKQGYTESVACENDRFGNACHSVYAAVYPMSVSNLFNYLAGNYKTAFTIAGCTLQQVLHPTGTIKQCVSTRGASIEAVGEPLWEGAGKFYIIGPVLKGSITLMLFVVYAGSIMLNSGLGRKKQ